MNLLDIAYFLTVVVCFFTLGLLAWDEQSKNPYSKPYKGPEEQKAFENIEGHPTKEKDP
jgi:hypothetical protein|tara:strand:- start:1933 stop:2109 length:177 start_codon:yes stop_codon:yes gene_type:complete